MGKGAGICPKRVVESQSKWTTRLSWHGRWVRWQMYWTGAACCASMPQLPNAGCRSVKTRGIEDGVERTEASSGAGMALLYVGEYQQALPLLQETEVMAVEQHNIGQQVTGPAWPTGTLLFPDGPVG